MRVYVRFNRNVLGRRAGTRDWVEATPVVETLVANGSLTWLNRPPVAPEDNVEPELPEHRMQLDLFDDIEDDDSVHLPSGETIPVEELTERLAWDDDGGAVDDDR